MYRKFSFTFLLLLLLFFASAIVAEIRYKSLENPLAVAEFSLLDQYAREFNLDKLRGAWTLMFVGFTSCPDVCPFTLENLEAVRAQLSMQMMPDKLPQVVFLAVDPARDKANLQQYMAHFHKDFIGITGDKTEIDKLSKSINSFYRLEDSRTSTGYYNVVHSSAVVLISPEAQVMASLSPPFAARETANLLLRFIRGQESEVNEDLVKIEEAWTPLGPSGLSAHAGYLTIKNFSQDDLVIVAFESVAYASISMHASEMQDGMMSMQELNKLLVPANSSLTLEPMGRHLMMFGSKLPEESKDFVVIMKTEKRGSYQLRMEIKDRRGKG